MIRTSHSLIRTSFKKTIKGLNSATHGVIAFVELPNHRVLPIMDFGAREIMAIVNSFNQVFFVDSRKTMPCYTGKEDAQEDRKKNGRKNGRDPVQAPVSPDGITVVIVIDRGNRGVCSR